MRLLRHPVSGKLAAIIAAGLAVGCLGSSPNVSLYTMSATPVSNATSAPDGLAIGVGPIGVPRYLDRPEWVTRPGGSTAQLEVDDYRQWAGGFSSNVLSVLGENLGAKLGTQRVVVYPAPTAFTLDYRVAVDFQEFEGIGGEAVVLRATWVIRAGTAEGGPWSGQSSIRRPIAGGVPRISSLPTTRLWVCSRMRSRRGSRVSRRPGRAPPNRTISSQIDASPVRSPFGNREDRAIRSAHDPFGHRPSQSIEDSVASRGGHHDQLGVIFFGNA